MACLFVVATMCLLRSVVLALQRRGAGTALWLWTVCFSGSPRLARRKARQGRKLGHHVGVQGHLGYEAKLAVRVLRWASVEMT